MTRVFIGGSRSITRLNAQVQRRLHAIIQKRLPVLIGDANGADKAVQRYLADHSYDRVEVFCIQGACRNNLGNWPERPVTPPRGARGFDLYSAKDVEMTREATVGFMLWDARSRGTLANISRLVEQGKNVLVYIAPSREFRTLARNGDWESFLSQWSKPSPRPAKRQPPQLERFHPHSRQSALF